MAIITTVWCQQKNCWLRFESQDGNNNAVKAFYSTQDQLGWVAVDDNEFLCTADYNLDDTYLRNDRYHLVEGELFQIKKMVVGGNTIFNIDKYVNGNWFRFQGQNAANYTKKHNDIFVEQNKGKAESAPPYNALPPTPEKYRELLDAQQEAKRQEDAINWENFKRLIPDYRAQGGQNFRGLTPPQKDFFQQHLSVAMTLNAMEPRNNAQEYLTQLDAILNDENHMILQTPIETSLRMRLRA